MKTQKFQRRVYRDWINNEDLYETRIISQETDLQIFTNKRLGSDFVKEKVSQYRWQIENYISRDRRLLVSLKPINVELTAPPIIQQMSEAARIANVGPMATVAGAIAQFLGRDLLKKGYSDVIIENGGDIFLKTTKTRSVGIYSGRLSTFNRLKLKINPKDSPLGICTSSGSVGHSLSFGCADSIVILSKNTLLADAVATATGNRVQSRKDLQPALDFTRSIKGVLGVIIILKKDLISWGKIEFSK